MEKLTYVSTRGGQTPASYSEIVLQGLAGDGGLFVPSRYPQFCAAERKQLRGLSYAQLAARILSRFAPEMAADMGTLCEATYRPEVYCNVRAGEDPKKIVGVRALGDEGIWLLELSAGPTLAFKDMAMQFLGALFEKLLLRTGTQLNILGATSGDTGSAAEYAMRGRKAIRVFMLSPHGRMSPFQQAQMFSLSDGNIFNLSIEGTFDDCQDIVKAVSHDLVFKTAHHIGTVNSINWARIAAQVVYYFQGWLALTRSEDEMVDVTVPSGNFGDILAGWIAKQMGLPLGQLVVATNENDVLDEFFRTGTYRVRDSAHTFVTSSPSMDISKASNFERYIYDIVGRNPQRIRDLWQDVAAKGGFTLSAEEFAAVKSSGFASGKSVHADRLATIADLWQKYRVLIDPHTADGVKVAREHKRAGVAMLSLETALPAKFAATIKEAVGFEPPVPSSYADLSSRKLSCLVMPAEVQRVEQFIDEKTTGKQ